MPIYEYHCSACDARFETIQKFSDPLLETCPHCDAASPTKLLSAGAFHLKGSGWYATDYKSGTKSSSAPSTGEDPTPATPSSSDADNDAPSTAPSTSKADPPNSSDKD